MWLYSSACGDQRFVLSVGLCNDRPKEQEAVALQTRQQEAVALQTQQQEAVALQTQQQEAVALQT
jgi:hypothetical protein